MKECVLPYYIKDGEIYECSSFNIDFINEGRSIYEVSRLRETRLLFLEDHIDRFFTSLQIGGLDSGIDKKEIRRQLQQLIKKNQVKEGNVKFVMNFKNPDSKTGNKNSFLAYFVTHRYPALEDYLNGVRIMSFPFERSDPNKKIWRPEFRREVSEAIRANGAFEALLLDARGMVPEASKANVFGIKDGVVITAPDEFILPGITRKYVLVACEELEIQVELRTMGLEEIAELDALFLTGTSIQVLPVSQVNNIKLSAQDMTIYHIMKQFETIIENHHR